MLRLVLPKGSLEAATLALFAAADLAVPAPRMSTTGPPSTIPESAR